MPIIDYNTVIDDICPGSLMDKTMDSGSIDPGSIPGRDAKNTSIRKDTGVCFLECQNRFLGTNIP